MASTSKRQQTMAKRNREMAVKEKRAIKQAKKYAAAQARKGEPLNPALIPHSMRELLQQEAAPTEPVADSAPADSAPAPPPAES